MPWIVLIATACIQEPTAVGLDPETDASGPVAGSVTKVEVLDPVAATQIRRGLGISVNAKSLTEIQFAKDMGASEVRIGFGWERVEKTPGVFALPPELSTALAKVKELGLETVALAAYGPGWVTIDTVVVTKAAAKGVKEIFINDSARAGNIIVGRDWLIREDNTQLVGEGYWAYAGAPITAHSASRASLSLSAPLTVALHIGDRLEINRRHYAIAKNVDGDPSVAAYVRYVKYIGEQLAATGVKGRVELWNEPPWAHDEWDGGLECFSNTASAGCGAPNYAFARAMLNEPAPTGVRWMWGGTHKSGINTLLGPRLGVTPTRTQIVDRLAFEAWHPYGESPEEGFWSPQCLRDAAAGTDVRTRCAFEGGNQMSNFKTGRKYAVDRLAASGWTLGHTITEAGIFTDNQAARTRYLLRSYLGYQSLGIDRVNYYRLIDGPAGTASYGWIDKTTRQPFPVFYAFQSMMADMDRLGTAPLTTDSVGVNVAEYHGDWPLMVVPIVGRASAGQSKNSLLLVIWQRTYSAGGVGTWQQIAKPSTGTATVTMPAGLTFGGAWSLADRATVNATHIDGTTLQLEVRDEPIVLRFDP